MYIQSHERVHAVNSPALSRDERFSRSKQQSDAILMKWLPRKKDLVLKIGVGVLRKVLNALAQVKIVWDEDVKIPDGFLGKTNIDEVTVFHVDLGMRGAFMVLDKGNATVEYILPSDHTVTLHGGLVKLFDDINN